ncbi:MAG: ABC transporter permease [Chloroflexi bacterium CFX1]|nr:ABC transporter permease [Chloroflexi bacterium CFX1]
MILVIPVMQLFLLGYSATNDVRNIPLAVLDRSHSPESRALLDAYRAADYFRIAFSVDSESEIEDLISRGEARAAVIIPPDYAQRLADGNAQIAFILDGSDPTSASTALSAAQLISQTHATDILAEKFSRSGTNLRVRPPVEARTTVWYNPDMVSAHFMIPGVIGKLMPYVILGFFNTIEALAVGHWWFGMPIRGDLGLILILSIVFLITGLGIGLLASTIANTQQEAMLTVWMTLLPSIFLSGFFFPLEAMPKFLQWVSYFMPLRYYLVIMRSLLLKGVGLEMIQFDVIAMTLFAVGIMTAAALRFRKRLD